MTARKQATKKRTARKKASRQKRDTSSRPAQKGSLAAARSNNGRGGKPSVQWNLKTLEKMAARWLSHEAMADLLEISRECLQTALRNNPDVKRAIRLGRAKRQDKLLTKQWANADRGNVVMQIWLGKNYLGQTDKVMHSNDPAAPFEADLANTIVLKIQAFQDQKRRQQELAEGRD